MDLVCPVIPACLAYMDVGEACKNDGGMIYFSLIRRHSYQVFKH